MGHIPAFTESISGIPILAMLIVHCYLLTYNTFHGIARYLDSCKKHRVLPNSAILSWLYKASLQKSNNQTCTMVISLDQLEDADISPLVEVFLNFQFDAISMLCKSSTGLCQESVVSLMHATGLKLHIVDLQHVSFPEDFLW